jgi:hypothetical protein
VHVCERAGRSQTRHERGIRVGCLLVMRVPASEAEIEAADGGAVVFHDSDQYDCVCEYKKSPWSHNDTQGANAHLLVMGPELNLVLGADMVWVAVLRPDI